MFLLIFGNIRLSKQKPIANICPRIDGLSEIASNYDAILCDVWGVLHNGVEASPDTIQALAEFKNSGKPTFLLTNAPRPNPQVLEQLTRLNVPLDTTFDQVVTSGDVTRQLIKTLNGKIFHIGTEFDRSLFAGLDVEFADWKEADFVICTGLYDDFNETPDDYAGLLSDLKSRDLVFVCANPDLVVEHGGIMRYCAGALAKKYDDIGGETKIIGKPHLPVYQHAHKLLNEFSSSQLAKSKILAIGDGINTDIAGALNYGLDALFISAGIHASQYGDADNPDEKKLQDFLDTNEKKPVAWMPRLKW